MKFRISPSYLSSFALRRLHFLLVFQDSTDACLSLPLTGRGGLVAGDFERLLAEVMRQRALRTDVRELFWDLQRHIRPYKGKGVHRRFKRLKRFCCNVSYCLKYLCSTKNLHAVVTKHCCHLNVLVIYPPVMKILTLHYKVGRHRPALLQCGTQ